MKSFLKIVWYLLLGFLIGFVIIVPVIALIDGESIIEVSKSLVSSKGMKLLYTMAAVVVATPVAYLIQLFAHEGGHLVAGLLTGYRFVSFRLLNYTLIRRDGRLQWRKYDLEGTGGQCLLSPPDKPLDQIKTRLYNAGGVLANILLAALCVILLCTFDMPVLLKIFLGIVVVISLYSALTNGIPLKLSGIPNDGFNFLLQEKNPTAKQYFVSILKTNALLQEGTQPKDMPADLYQMPEEPINWKDPMCTITVLLASSRLMNLHQWEEAYRLQAEAYAHKGDIIPLYVNEINGLMTVTCIATGRDDEARQHYDKETRDYVSHHAPTQSDKRLTAMAATLALDNDRPAAEEMYRQLQADRDRFIHQGDVAMSLDLMQWLLDNRQ